MSKSIQKKISHRVVKNNLIDMRRDNSVSTIIKDGKITITCEKNIFASSKKHDKRYNTFLNEIFMILVDSDKMFLNDRDTLRLITKEITLLEYTFKSCENIKTFENKIINEQISKNDTLLDCDKIRVNIESYDEQILTDINRGHWEAKSEKDVVYKNPINDIKDNCVVGIDFGTKSTVVVCQDENEITLPMMIGGGRAKDFNNSKSYENPTILEFINLESFLKDYNESEGRPKTKWDDLTISHTASSALLEGSSSSDFYSFFNELKQWCVDKSSSINIKDKQDNIYELKNFLDLDESDFNPIEIYAYYLGLHINNMRNGIFLEYLLSFPVTYEKEVREKIIESFYKGIKKSLPIEILEDEKSISKLKVLVGATEPSAYAISALNEYGFDPEDDEKIFYGVFDFGGGTTDFDFGLFREANQKGERRYDYAIEHFGAGGDKYLGGENLLHLIAYEVFKDNIEELLNNNIKFRMHKEGEKFSGQEFLIDNSQEARLNTHKVMDELRPIWEKREGYESIGEKGCINTSLFKSNGEMITGFELKVDAEKLENILEKRIENGIENFFESLRLSFSDKRAIDCDSINIFLAGNSSKSVYVEKIFNKYMEKESNMISANEEVATTIENMFNIFPPLGTDKAYEKQEELGLEVVRENLKRPTGKTGVAFGLIESRNGGSIKVINDNDKGDESKFNYYVGMKKKKMLKPILSPESSYGEWVELIDAYESDIEIHYTTSPKASTGKLDISETTRLKITLDETFEDEDIFVYVRAITPSQMEYGVFREDNLNDSLVEIKTLSLK